MWANEDGIYTGYIKNTEENGSYPSQEDQWRFFWKKKAMEGTLKVKWGWQNKASPTGRRAPVSGHTGGHHFPAGMGCKGRQALPSPVLGSKTRWRGILNAIAGPRALLITEEWLWRASSPGVTWSNSHVRYNFLNWLLFANTASPASRVENEKTNKQTKPDSFQITRHNRHSCFNLRRWLETAREGRKKRMFFIDQKIKWAKRSFPKTNIPDFAILRELFVFISAGTKRSRVANTFHVWPPHSTSQGATSAFWIGRHSSWWMSQPLTDPEMSANTYSHCRWWLQRGIFFLNNTFMLI